LIGQIQETIRETEQTSKAHQLLNKLFNCSPSSIKFKVGTVFAIRSVIDQLSRYVEKLHANIQKDFSRRTSACAHQSTSNSNSQPKTSKRSRQPANLLPNFDYKTELIKKVIKMISHADPDLRFPEIEVEELSRISSKITFSVKCAFCVESASAYVLGYQEGKYQNVLYVFSNLTQHIYRAHEKMGKNLASYSVSVEPLVFNNQLQYFKI
jgi:hypothetical protein